MNQYVSRGGIKLAHALREFNVDVSGKIVLDVGSSTGGFVDALLKNGAVKVYSVDTAYGELAWTLRNDPRVVVMERQNILFLESLPEQADLITVDVTFTSLEKILPVVKKFLKENGQIIALVKPQYERQDIALKNRNLSLRSRTLRSSPAFREKRVAGLRGIIPEEFHAEIVDGVIKSAESNGYNFLRKIDSPILGGSGNKEFLVLCKLQN